MTSLMLTRKKFATFLTTLIDKSTPAALRKLSFPDRGGADNFLKSKLKGKRIRRKIFAIEKRL